MLIEIRYAGICHSDIHTVRGEWGAITYPLTVGHEIVGDVAEVGSEVTKHAVGDRVGVGCMVNSCRECANCLAGEEQYCLNGNTGTYGAVDRDGTITQGGYSTHVVVDEDFVLRVPSAIPYEAAAPLLCAGITTYSPLAHWKAGPGTKVAVVGLGGLGHMAVKIAHAMGADVTVLSQTLNKKDDGIRLGADSLLRHQRSGHVPAARQHVRPDRQHGQRRHRPRRLPVAAAPGRHHGQRRRPAEALPLHVFTLFSNRRSFAGSGIGSIRETQEMLDFCAEHGIACDIELIDAEQINEAYDRVARVRRPLPVRHRHRDAWLSPGGVTLAVGLPPESPRRKRRSRGANAAGSSGWRGCGEPAARGPSGRRCATRCSATTGRWW